MTALALHSPRPSVALRTTPSWWRDACLAVVGAGTVLVVGLWAANEPGLGLIATGRLTGLLGSWLLLVQVLLMARVPAVERSFGQDALARWHRVVGFSSFWLVVAHIVLTLLGYARQDGTPLLTETWDVTWTYPGMLAAAGGFAALVMVVVTSIRVARARLRYESWHLLHLYAYVGVGLALPHQLWTGGDFVGNPTATAFWWSAWALTAATVLAYRVGLPVYRSLRHGLVVDRVVAEAPGVVSVHLSGRDLDRLPVRAGQFFVFRFLDGEGWSRGNPYSLSAAPDGRTLRITAKDLGDGSGRLATMAPGTKVLIEGPYGRLTADTRTRPKAAYLVAGIGITPALALVQEQPEHAVVVQRGEPLLTEGLPVISVPGPRAADGAWRPVQAAHLSEREALLRLVPDVADRDVFVCGAGAWADAMAQAARDAGVPAAQLHVERFDW